MYNEIIEIIKTWSGFGQFLFFFITILSVMMPLILAIHMVGKFFTRTLPILLRGWPSYDSNKALDSEDDDV